MTAPGAARERTVEVHSSDRHGILVVVETAATQQQANVTLRGRVLTVRVPEATVVVYHAGRLDTTSGKCELKNGVLYASFRAGE